VHKDRQLPGPAGGASSEGNLASLARELVELARSAPEELKTRVASLTVREQAELALRLPAAQRLELLLHSPKPLRLVRSLPDSEIYLTAREVGPTDATPVIALASASQLVHLVDLEGWRRDRFDAQRSGAWVALFLEAGEPALRRFLRAADDELLALLSVRWMRIAQLEYEDSPEVHGHGQGDAGTESGSLTPDGYHRYSPTIAEHAPAIGRLLKVFFDDQPERYQQVLWSAQWELASDLEEQALHWRQLRLEEHGFPEWEEALSVYAPPEGVSAHPTPLEPSDPDGLPASRLPLRQLGAAGALVPAIDRLPDESRERVLHEVVSLANHLLVADCSDPGEPSAHTGALDKAGSYVRIALEHRNLLGSSEIATALVEIPVVEWFRQGYALAADLQARAESLFRRGWPGGERRALAFLDSPIRERVEGLLEPRPVYFEFPRDEGTGRFRHFRSLAELDECRVAMEMAEFAGELFVTRLGFDVQRVLADAESRETSVPRFSTLLLTTLAWNAVRAELRGDPLPDAAASDFLRTVASRKTAGPDAPARALESLVRAIADRGELSARQLAVLQAFGRFCLEQLAEECANLDPGVPLDPTSINCLLLKPQPS
jgi:hypothetical protein